MPNIKIYDVICDQCENEADAIEYLKETYYEAELTDRDTLENPIQHSRLVDTVEGGTLDIYYDYGADYYFCAVNEGDL
jgi:hypothetical protein